MTATEHNGRGRGRPKGFDELEAVDRIRTREDLFVIRDALVANGEPAGQSSGCIVALDRIRSGDPTGGVSRMQLSRYRAMLARLPEFPLPAPSRRRRRTAARGFASPRLLAGGSGAGIMALAAQTPSVALRAIGLAGPPIILDRVQSDSPAEIPGRVVLLRPRAADGIRECVPGAGLDPRPTRAGYVLELEVAA